jgi:hypothetical protein
MHIPKNAVVVPTYAEFERFARAYAAGHLNLLIVLGSPGLSKTRVMHDAVGPAACCIEGHATPFGVYRLLWQHQHQPIVIDDADSLFHNPEGIRLMKALCQTDAAKRIAWHTDNRTLKEEDIPREFETTSKVTIVANQWCPRNADVQALEDRGHILLFQPSAVEVHLRTATWFWSQEIFDFFAAHLGLITEPSMRHYLAAWELRQAGFDWKTLILSRFLSGPALQVARLKADPTYGSEKERIKAFIDAEGGCRATYFAHAKKLPAKVDVARTVLANTTPPSVEKRNVLSINGFTAEQPDLELSDAVSNGSRSPEVYPFAGYAPNAE